jgi:hypothetical protein
VFCALACYLSAAEKLVPCCGGSSANLFAASPNLFAASPNLFAASPNLFAASPNLFAVSQCQGETK